MQSQNKNFFIKGSGFKSIAMALAIKKKFPYSKIILEKNKNFGGIYSGIKFKNFYLDIGCHLFDYTDEFFLNLFEINKKKIIPVQLEYKSLNNFGTTKGYAIYDFRNNKNITKLQRSFLKNLKKNKNNSNINLHSRYENKYGTEITKIIDKFCLKITGKKLKKINFYSNEFFMFDRILLFNTTISLKLKKKGLEDFLATPSRYNHDFSKGKIVFTFKNGTYGFIKHVLNLFKKKKIIFKNKYNIKNTRIINPMANSNFLSNQLIDIPLHVIYLKCKKFRYTYFHDYTESPIFRVSSPGFYSKQYKNKYSYICVEVPDPNYKYSKEFLIKYAIKYIEKYCKSEVLHYLFTKKSYPSIYKNYNGNKNYLLNPFIYSKKKLLKNIREYVDRF